MNHFPRQKVLALAIGCIAWQPAAFAQEAPTEDNGQAEEASESSVALEEVVVLGVRGAQAKAIDLKRNASNVIDSIVAEDIGKLPDVTITDSLQRITGVQIKREANQGTSLNVRGMPQVLTTLNGEQFLSPWSITGIGANYGDIPAGMISGVDVYKSTSADMLAGGISGVVDLKTYKPLSIDGTWTVKSKLELSQGSLSDEEIKSNGEYGSRKPDHDVSLFVGHNNGDVWGFTLGLFNNANYAANYQVRNDQFRLAFLDRAGGRPGDPLDLDKDGDLVNDWYLTPQDFSVNSNFMERDRAGASFSLEANFNDNFSGRADIFYTAMDQYDRGVQAVFRGASNLAAYSVNGSTPEPENRYNVLQADSILGGGARVDYLDDSDTNQTATVHGVSVAHIISPEFQSKSTNQVNRTAALNSNFQLNYTNNDNFEGTLRFVHAEAEKEYRKAELQQGTPAWLWVNIDGTPGKDPLVPFDVVIDYRGDVPSFAFTNDLSSPDLLASYQAFGDGENTEASLDVLRADGKFEFHDNKFIESVSFGLRYGERDVEYEKFYYVAPTARYSNWDNPRIAEDKRFLLRTDNEIWQKYPEWRRFDIADEDQNLVTIGGLEQNDFSTENIIAFTDFGPFDGFSNGVSAVNPANWDNPLVFLNRMYPGTRTANEPGDSYSVNEASTSIFGQLIFHSDTGIWGIPFSGNIGARIVKTDRAVEKSIIPEILNSENSIGFDDWQRIAFVSKTENIKHSFTDFLPSFNINFFPTDDVVARFAGAKTTSRNDLANVGKSPVLWYQQCSKTDPEGNKVYVGEDDEKREVLVSCVGGGSDTGRPDIKPWSANVFNTSAEWYFGDNSVLAGGLFYIDINESVESYQEQRSFIDGDGFDRGQTGNVWVTANVGGSSLYGVELAYKQPFTDLFKNEYLGATGIEINYTYSKSESNINDIEGNALPLPSNSAQQSNFILWYDKSGINSRLAYNWRSEEYIGNVGINSNGVPLTLGNWQEPTGYLDFSFSYWLNDHFSMYFNATNLLAENRKTYAQFEDQLHSIWVQERRYSIGVNLAL